MNTSHVAGSGKSDAAAAVDAALSGDTVNSLNLKPPRKEQPPAATEDATSSTATAASDPVVPSGDTVPDDEKTFTRQDTGFPILAEPRAADGGLIDLDGPSEEDDPSNPYLSIDDPVDPNSNNGDSSGAKTAAQATAAAAESKAEEEEQPGSIPAPLDPALTLTAADVKAALDDAKVNHPDPKAAPATDEKADEEADGVDRADPKIPKIVEVKWGAIETELNGKQKTFKRAKLYSDYAEEWDWKKHGTKHKPGMQHADVEDCLVDGLEFLILTMGMNGVLQVPDDLIQKLEKENKGLKVLKGRTGEMFPEYEKLRLSGAKVAAVMSAFS